jgi:hypothetical protein
VPPSVDSDDWWRNPLKHLASVDDYWTLWFFSSFAGMFFGWHLTSETFTGAQACLTVQELRIKVAL